MASFVYTKFFTKRWNGTISGSLASLDWRVMLLDSSTTADTENGAEFISTFATLGELTGTGYVRKACASEAVAEDLANFRAEFIFDPITWTGIDAGTAAAALLYIHITDDDASIPVAYIDSGGFPKTTNGGDLTFTPNAEGVLQYSNAA